MRDGKMHQTTVRFGPDLWEALEVECARLGVSAAQFLREAALARLAYAAGRRGELEYERALVDAGAQTLPSAKSERRQPISFEAEVAALASQSARGSAAERNLESSAVAAQSEQVRARARAVRDHSIELRRATAKWRAR